MTQLFPFTLNAVWGKVRWRVSTYNTESPVTPMDCHSHFFTNPYMHLKKQTILLCKSPWNYWIPGLFLIKNIGHLYISGQKSHCLPCLYFNFKLQKLDRCLIILLMYYNEKNKQLWKIYCFLLYTTASLLLAVELGPTWCREQIFQQVIDFKRTPEIILAGCYTENESPLINHFWGNFSFWINSLFLSTWHLSA